MSNSYFEFRQMRIEQDQCAMKVSTDACIQGAWTPLLNGVKSVLDIGCGTGLLSLMLAQRNNELKIDALEIDPLAAKQAKENVANSIFSNQISVIECDAKTWKKESPYDLIICNPPFFTNSLKSENEARKLARHNDDFSFDDLLNIISENLNASGSASILLPLSEAKRWEDALSKNELKATKSLLIKPFAQSKPNRMVQILGKEKLNFLTEELIIYQEEKRYTSEFTDLLRPFYLHL